MYARLQDLMQWRLSLLAAGRYRDLAEEYLYPFPVYLAGRQQVVSSAAAMEQVLARLAGLTAGQGIARIEAQVLAVELPRLGRFRVWMRQEGFGPDGTALGASRYLHYCRLTTQGIKTEMSDYPECRADWVLSEPLRVRA